MKKTIIAFMIVLSPILVSAQTVDQATQTQIEAIVSRIVELKVQIILIQIEELKAQIAELIAQGQTSPANTTNNTTTTAETAQAVPAPVVVETPTPIIDMTTSCGTGGPILDIETSNLFYNQMLFTFSGFDSVGEYHTQRSLIRNADRHIDWIPAGTYQYSITAYSGFTGPFTENTPQDTRKVELVKSGELVLGPCI